MTPTNAGLARSLHNKTPVTLDIIAQVVLSNLSRVQLELIAIKRNLQSNLSALTVHQANSARAQA